MIILFNPATREVFVNVESYDDVQIEQVLENLPIRNTSVPTFGTRVTDVDY